MTTNSAFLLFGERGSPGFGGRQWRLRHVARLVVNSHPQWKVHRLVNEAPMAPGDVSFDEFWVAPNEPETLVSDLLMGMAAFALHRLDARACFHVSPTLIPLPSLEDGPSRFRPFLSVRATPLGVDPDTLELCLDDLRDRVRIGVVDIEPNGPYAGIYDELLAFDLDVRHFVPADMGDDQ